MPNTRRTGRINDEPLPGLTRGRRGEESARVRAEVTEEIIASLKAAGVTFACYLPDSWLADVERRLHDEPSFTVVPVVNEGEGVAMCAGAWLGGKRSVMLMENS